MTTFKLTDLSEILSKEGYDNVSDDMLADMAAGMSRRIDAGQKADDDAGKFSECINSVILARAKAAKANPSTIPADLLGRGLSKEGNPPKSGVYIPTERSAILTDLGWYHVGYFSVYDAVRDGINRGRLKELCAAGKDRRNKKAKDYDPAFDAQEKAKAKERNRRTGTLRVYRKFAADYFEAGGTLNDLAPATGPSTLRTKAAELRADQQKAGNTPESKLAKRLASGLDVVQDCDPTVAADTLNAHIKQAQKIYRELCDQIATQTGKAA